ncbi:MAG: diacylglycerol O-acyltransferase / wax synthase, partial [Actinomycetota bacterium]|nr:diacylglycerol O-acyltransferase / wax synthase [Actinomycetota bacterium]
VTRMIPLAPKGGAAVNIAFLTYNGNAEIGINIDTEAVPDPEEMTACLQAGFDEVVASAE